MAIFVDEKTEVIVQGLTGGQDDSTACETATTGPKVVAASRPARAART